MRNLAIEALKHRYEGQKKAAEYTIENYLNNPVAIGEHPDLLSEIDKALNSWSDADGKIAVLEKIEDNEYKTLFD
tara:strand:+ start:128 stop:352 length:225 start_codon:yes stop_codon:yes gene_type:complete